MLRSKTFWVWVALILLALLMWAGLVYLFMLALVYYYLDPFMTLVAVFAAAFSG
jgi:hypothetical protein